MKKSKTFFILLFCLNFICVFAFVSQAQVQSNDLVREKTDPQTQQQQQTENTEIEKWIKDASVDSQKGAIFNYTYQLKVSYEKRKKFGFGRKFTRIYQAVLPSRFTLAKLYSHPLVLIQDSEKPVSQTDVENARQDLIKEMERAEKVADKTNEEARDIDGGYWTIRLKADKQRAKVDIFKMLEIAKFNNLQNSIVAGRDTISIDFSPQAVLIYDNSLSYLSKIEGKMWIDRETKRIIRVEGFPLGIFKDVKDKTDAEREEEAVLFFLQTRVRENFWFPQTVRLDFTNHSSIFEPIKLEFSFSNYSKASVNVHDLQMRPPEQTQEETKITETNSDSNQSKEQNILPF